MLAVISMIFTDLFFSLITSRAFLEVERVDRIKNKFPKISVEKVKARVSPAECPAEMDEK